MAYPPIWLKDSDMTGVEQQVTEEFPAACRSRSVRRRGSRARRVERGLALLPGGRPGPRHGGPAVGDHAGDDVAEHHVDRSVGELLAAGAVAVEHPAQVEQQG